MHPISAFAGFSPAQPHRSDQPSESLFRGRGHHGKAHGGFSRHAEHHHGPRDHIALSPRASKLLRAVRGNESGALDLARGDHGFESIGKGARKALKALHHDLRDTLRDLGFDRETIRTALRSFIKPALQALRRGEDFSGRLTAFNAQQATIVSGGDVTVAQSLVAKSIAIDINQATGSVSINVESVSFQSFASGALGSDFVAPTALADILKPLIEQAAQSTPALLDEITPSDATETIDAALIAAIDAETGDDEAESAAPTETKPPETAPVPVEAVDAEPVGAEPVGAVPAESVAGVAEVLEPVEEPAAQAFHFQFRLDSVTQIRNENGETVTRIRIDAAFQFTLPDETGPEAPVEPSEPVVATRTDPASEDVPQVSLIA